MQRMEAGMMEMMILRGGVKGIENVLERVKESGENGGIQGQIGKMTDGEIEERLKKMAARIGALLERYDDAGEFGQQRILGICANFPGDDRILSYMLDKLRNRPQQRALYASFLGKLGDPRAIDAMKPFLTLTDIGYLDYIELRNAIEELGGDPGEERTFYGDPDYEAMRNI
jgi:hypothetical protein